MDNVGFQNEHDDKKGKTKSNSEIGKTGEFQLNTDGSIAGVDAYEDILRIIGTTGKWNVFMFILSCVCHLPSPMHTITYEFLGATPDHWCHVDELVNANWTDKQILDVAIPSSNTTDSGHDGCHYYNYDYAVAAELGYDEVMKNPDSIKINNSSDKLKCTSRDFNYTQVSSSVAIEWDLVCENRALYSTTSAGPQFGILVGSIIAGYLGDIYGRRPITLICMAMSLICSLVAAVSPNFIFYLAMKILTSFFNFGYLQVAFIAGLEWCDVEQRSTVASMFFISWSTGYVIIPGIAYLISSWRWLQATYGMFFLMLLPYFWVFPESPRWLIVRSRYDEAFTILSKAAEYNKTFLPPTENLFASMKKMAPIPSKKSKNTIINRIFKGIKRFFIFFIRPEFRLKIVVTFFCWFSVSMVYYGLSQNSGNLSLNPYIYMFLGGCVEIPSYFMLRILLRKFGRIKSIVFLYLVCAVTLSIVAILLTTEEKSPIGIMILSLVGKFCILPAFVIEGIFTSELFPTKYRSNVLGQANALARAGSILSPYINDLLGQAVKWLPSAIFAAFPVAAAGLNLLLPETSNEILKENFKKDTNEHQQNDCRRETQNTHNPSFEDNI